MKIWPLIFVACTIVCWGAYVPTLHQGQQAFGDRNSALRAFLFIGLAYFLVAGAVLAYMFLFKAEPFELTKGGAGFSTVAGILGAIGALGIVFAHKMGGKPIWVAPLVFAGAPIINTVVSMIWHRPDAPPSKLFYLGILLAGAGAALALRFKPI